MVARSSAMGMDALHTTGASGVDRPYRPNFLLAWLYKVFFSKIDVDPLWVRKVRDASAQGTVVYVMRSVSYLDFLLLDFFLKKYALPLIRFVTDTGLWVLEPMGKGLRRLFSRREPEGPALERALSHGYSPLLFMRAPGNPIRATARRGKHLPVDHVRVLVKQQRASDKPIVLVPQVVVWGKRPDHLQRSVVDKVFGSQEYPGRVRIAAQLLWHLGNAKLRACEPIDLKQYLADHPGLDDDALVAKIHWALVTRLDRERRVILGPVAKGPDRLKQEIIRHPRIRAVVQEEATRENKPIELVERTLKRDLDRLEARSNPFVLGIAGRMCDYIFNHVFQGIELDAEGLERIRDAERRGPVVLLPSHKSHFDYILLQYVFWRDGLQCPLIAAGDNLAFWPAGPILRRCGAFFIRRSFKGAPLYTAMVEAYVRKILKEGYAIKFFLEGGRSRTGKLLAPKTGLLAMVTDAARAANIEVTYVPIAIGYERVVEQRSYVAELSGAEKQREDAGALLRAPRILTTRYGRAYMQVGASQRYVQHGDDAVARKTAIEDLAQRVSAETDRATPVTPAGLVATVLLAVRVRGVDRDEMLARVDGLVKDLRASGARFAESLAVGSTDGEYAWRVDAIDQAIQLLTDGGTLEVHGPQGDQIYRVPDDKRLAVDFYKNNLLHFFVPRAMVATALLAPPGAQAGVARGALLERVRRLTAWLAHEFRFGTSVESLFDDALARLLRDGSVLVTGEGESALVRANDGRGEDELRFLAGIARAFVESAKITVRSLSLVAKKPMAPREWSRKALALGHRMALTGDVLHREAVSKPNLENAMLALKDAGVVTGGAKEPWALAPGYDTPEALGALEQRVAGYLA